MIKRILAEKLIEFSNSFPVDLSVRRNENTFNRLTI